MTLDLKALGAKAAAAQPMGYGSVPVVHQRTLLVDGDGLCYYCAGNDDTDIGTARHNLLAKVVRAADLVGAGTVRILMTGSGSHKGHRYAIARGKPYQGQRAGSRRPKNWEGLRTMLENSFLDRRITVETTYTAEADDLFGFYAYNDPDNIVILTQDKDMRMLPGTHLDWVTNRVHVVEHGLATVRQEHIMYNRTVVDSVFNDKQYGPKWFWLQMLHGDTADNIPGLPKYSPNWDGKFKPVGEVTASKLLDDPAYLPDPTMPASHAVSYWYSSYYGDRWLVEMLEQACLLWMRRDPNNWADCAEYGGPMYQFTDHEYWPAAYAEIEQRVRQADELNAIQT